MSAADEAPVVIVGAGHGGGTLVGTLRQLGYEGPVVLIGSEPDAPYHRPPLSKKFHADELEDPLRPLEFYEEQGITLRLSEDVVAIDPEARTVRLGDDTELAYSTLVLATGAEPRRLPVPGGDLDGVVVLRTLADARVLKDAVHPDKRLVIVGAGYVGLEVAAVARSVGQQVTVLEREDRVLARVASPELSEILTGHHVAQGTEVLTSADVTGFAGDDDGHVRAVVLGDGREIPCDLALVGVGAIPRDELASAAGLTCDGGIVVDAATRTSDPHVLAIGDVTRRPVGNVEELVRMESIPSAMEQAKQAAHVIVGKDVPAADVPWFWSDQFDLKLKMAGLLRPGHAAVVRGDPTTGRFTVFHLDGDVIAAVESANAPKEFMAGKKYIRTRQRVDVTRLADEAVGLKDVVA
ncbi:NAD(P)/FAD-dependent oxidoreductase [Patulibacter minatonensis]|uniref:NAD(P)/FAD-dependent oxidoreductase n=1 Tax=Patulibacter minatonensis TaxID=298163 RepID=UPI000479B57B|nr:FAD-dependent oxidoreductase [Patulibacter minatonensis]